MLVTSVICGASVVLSIHVVPTLMRAIRFSKSGTCAVPVLGQIKLIEKIEFHQEQRSFLTYVPKGSKTIEQEWFLNGQLQPKNNDINGYSVMLSRNISGIYGYSPMKFDNEGNMSITVETKDGIYRINDKIFIGDPTNEQELLDTWSHYYVDRRMVSYWSMATISAILLVFYELYLMCFPAKY